MGRWEDSVGPCTTDKGTKDHRVTWVGRVFLSDEQRPLLRTVIESASDTYAASVIGCSLNDEIEVEVYYGPVHGANMRDVVRFLEEHGIIISSVHRVRRDHVTDGSCQKKGCTG